MWYGGQGDWPGGGARGRESLCACTRTGSGVHNRVMMWINRGGRGEPKLVDILVAGARVTCAVLVKYA